MLLLFLEDFSPLKHPVAHNLDLCMLKLFQFLLRQFNSNQNHNNNKDILKHDSVNIENMKFFDLLIKSFENAILPTHNTQYVQFIFFYVCSFKVRKEISKFILIISIFYNSKHNFFLAFLC